MILVLSFLTVKTETIEEKIFHPPMMWLQYSRQLMVYRQVIEVYEFILKTSKSCNHISYLSPHLDPLAYPLLWSNGEHRWKTGMFHNESRSTSVRNKVTIREFNCSRLFERFDWFNAVLHSGKLTQQIIVDYYCRHESSRLDWIRRNQEKLRTETYAGLCDVITSEGIRAGVMKNA